MKILNIEEFNTKYGYIKNYAYLTAIKKIFINTSKNVWVFVNPDGFSTDEIFDRVNDYLPSQASPRRCNCREYSCHKCYLNNSFYVFRRNKPYHIYSYTEVYKELMAKSSPGKALKFKRMMMELTDEQF